VCVYVMRGRKRQKKGVHIDTFGVFRFIMYMYRSLVGDGGSGFGRVRVTPLYF